MNNGYYEMVYCVTCKLTKQRRHDSALTLRTDVQLLSERIQFVKPSSHLTLSDLCLLLNSHPLYFNHQTQGFWTHQILDFCLLTDKSEIVPIHFSEVLATSGNFYLD